MINHLTIIFLLLLASILLGCGTEPSRENELFIVKVDSIKHHKFYLVGDTIKIWFYGTIGSDGCHSFYRFEGKLQPLQLDLTVYGKKKQADVCPCVMVYLDGKEYRLIATQQGLFTINIYQPDGSVLRDSLLVMLIR